MTVNHLEKARTGTGEEVRDLRDGEVYVTTNFWKTEAYHTRRCKYIRESNSVSIEREQTFKTAKVEECKCCKNDNILTNAQGPQVHTRLRMSILKGNIPAGQAITTQEAAEMLECSKHAARNCLGHLCDQGHVTRVDRKPSRWVRYE